MTSQTMSREDYLRARYVWAPGDVEVAAQNEATVPASDKVKPAMRRHTRR